jgi:3-phosphoshikimate 1-carboxyvinyltransferase
MDTRRITPLRGPLDADVVVPGSKSIANRALVCATLARGTSVLRYVPDGDDTAAMFDCLAALGVSAAFDDGVAAIDGLRARLPVGPVVLPTRLAGTTSRFVTAMAALGQGPFVIDGAAPLRARPMAALHDALGVLGVGVRPLGEPGHLPVEISGPPRGWRVALPGDVSSQFVSALMLAAPYFPNGVRLDLTSPLVSRPYVEMTARVMGAFGMPAVEVRSEEIEVLPGSYRAVDYTIEPDASSAGYPLAAAAICGGRVRVLGLSADSIQGDAQFADLLGRMGAEVAFDAEGVSVRGGGPLRGVEVDMSSCSDLVPTLAVVAAFAESPTIIHGVGFIRAKESDRIGDLCSELRRAGVHATPLRDGLTIVPGFPVAQPATLDTHGDHRLAMAFAVLGLAIEGIAVNDPGVVSKSWPGFWSMLDRLSQ